MTNQVYEIAIDQVPTLSDNLGLIAMWMCVIVILASMIQMGFLGEEPEPGYGIRLPDPESPAPAGRHGKPRASRDQRRGASPK